MRVSAKNPAIEVLSTIARRGEFWECVGVEQTHLGVVESSMQPGDDVVEMSKVMVDLFEEEKRHTACPTSAVNRSFPALAELRRPGEPMADLVEDYKRLIPFERERKYIDAPRNALATMKEISEHLGPYDNRHFCVTMFMQDPGHFADNLERYHQENRGKVEELVAAPREVDFQLEPDWLSINAIEVPLQAD